MARKYTQNIRIERSYEAYKNQLERLNQNNIATLPALPYLDYKAVYKDYSHAGVKNIARTIATNYSEVTIREEAQFYQQKIKEYVGDENVGDFLNQRELRALSGRELWAYFKDIGMSDREAGATYDREEKVFDASGNPVFNSKGNQKVIKRARIRRD